MHSTSRTEYGCVIPGNRHRTGIAGPEDRPLVVSAVMVRPAEAIRVYLLPLWTLLPLILAGCATSDQAEAGPDKAAPERSGAFPTADYWPLTPGRVWIFEREGFPDQQTTIQLLPAPGGGMAAWFTKNHRDTYWGPGDVLDLYWHLSHDGRYLVANNAKDPDYGNAFNHLPDDRRYRRDTGQWSSDIWFVQGDDERVPPYVLLPDRLAVPHEMKGTQYYAIYQDDRSWWRKGTWRVRYRLEQATLRADSGAVLFDGEWLRVLFDESIDNIDDGLWEGLPEQTFWVHEDWCFARGVGPVQIEQYLTAERRPEDLHIRIKLLESRQELALTVVPDDPIRPAEGEIAVPYTFEVLNGKPRMDPGIVITRDPAGPAGQPLATLNPDAAWRENLFTFPWSLTAEEMTGTWLFKVHDELGRTAETRLTIRERPLGLTVSPSRVVRPDQGSRPITYRFTVTGGEPDKGVGIVAIASPGPQRDQPVPLASLVHDDRWEGETYVFSWTIDSTTEPGTYVYRAQDTRGRTALTLLRVE